MSKDHLDSASRFSVAEQVLVLCYPLDSTGVIQAR